jgi:hypothetical protein
LVTPCANLLWAETRKFQDFDAYLLFPLNLSLRSQFLLLNLKILRFQCQLFWYILYIYIYVYI